MIPGTPHEEGEEHRVKNVRSQEVHVDEHVQCVDGQDSIQHREGGVPLEVVGIHLLRSFSALTYGRHDI